MCEDRYIFMHTHYRDYYRDSYRDSKAMAGPYRTLEEDAALTRRQSKKIQSTSWHKVTTVKNH